MDWSKGKGLLLDLCGVLYNADEAIEGSVEGLKLLRQTDLQIRFVTNESQKTRAALVSELNKLGFDLKIHEVFSPPIAASKYLSAEGLRPKCLVSPEVLEDLNDVPKENPNCVLLGDAVIGFHYDALNSAFQVLMEHPKLFSMGAGRYYKQGTQLMLDVGPFLKALEYAAGVKGEIIGKPAKEFFMTAVNDMGLEPHEVTMIGDDIESDVGGAQACGMRGIQVRTGKFRPSDENHPRVKPDLYTDNLFAVAREIHRVRKK